MSGPLKIAVVEYQAGGQVLIRCRGGHDAIKYFGWVKAVPEGFTFPEDGLAVVRQAFTERGWVVTEAGQAAPPSTIKSHRMPLPLPECRECHAPYRRDYLVRDGDRCTACGVELELVQVDPNADARGPVRHCPECGRAAGQAWTYCPCGALLPDLRQAVEAHVPWRERLAGMGVDVGKLFAMPDDVEGES